MATGKLNRITDLRKAVIEPLGGPLFDQPQVTVEILRLDLIHPLISGNKWFKLKYYLQEAVQLGRKGLFSVGGAFSNHLLATAAAARAAGLSSAALVRGEAATTLSCTLQDAAGLGMELNFVSREEYRQRHDPAYLRRWQDRYPDHLIIPEGGAGEPGVRGAADILDLAQAGSHTHVLAACGTGTMLLGLARKAAGKEIIGISVLKGLTDPFAGTGLASLAADRPVRLLTGYHFGGYARHQPALLQFMNQCYSDTGIPTDFVYTGKLLFAVSDLLKKGYFPAGSRLLVIHSGGLQGNRSLPPGTLLY